jgi:hypothetical protein
MVDATKFDGEVTTKEVLLDASVAARRAVGEQEAEGDVAAREIKDETGKDVIGRWIVTTIGPA